MNTCSRLEGSGQRGRIHTSRETADQIIKAGKGEWLQKRTDSISLKGKGSIESFWVVVKGERAGSVVSAQDEEELVARGNYGPKFPDLNERTNRLVDWNVEMLLGLLKQIVARRSTLISKKLVASSRHVTTLENVKFGSTQLEEVREIIALPEFDEKAARMQLKPEEVVIPKEVVQQLHNLVGNIASMYNENPFHNCMCTTMNHRASLTACLAHTSLLLLYLRLNSRSCIACGNECDQAHEVAQLFVVMNWGVRHK